MRLIDADNLEDQFCEIVGEYTVTDIQKIIDNAPTVPLPDFKEGYKQAIIDGKTNFSRPQGDLINREDLRNVILNDKKLDGANANWEVNRILVHIENAPTIKLKQGEWLKHSTGHSIYYDCSLCGCVAPCMETADNIFWKMANYCPDCGADMRGVE